MRGYFQHIVENIDLDFDDWSNIKTINILLTGATGLIGKFLLDTLLILQIKYQFDIKIIVLVTDLERFIQRFPYFRHHQKIVIYQTNLLNLQELEKITDQHRIDYVIHAASPADPKRVFNSPISTINCNILVTENLLKICMKKKATLIFLSSSEIYGQGFSKKICENDLGYINLNTLESCYAQSKRTAESMCIAYHHECDVDFVILRLPRTYGSTAKQDDPRILSYALRQAANGNDIYLKTSGNQQYSTLYVADCVRSILYAMSIFQKNSAYNIADPNPISLKDFCSLVCKYSQKKIRVVHQEEKQDYDHIASKTTCSILDTAKSQLFGYQTQYSISSAIKMSLNFLLEEKK